MCKYTVQELADMIGQTRQYVNQYKRRGKINVSDGMIDLKDPLNKHFYDPRRAKYMDKVKNGTLPDDVPVRKVKTTSKKEEQKTKSDSTKKDSQQSGKSKQPNNSSDSAYSNLSMEKLEAEVRKKNADAAKSELELERMQGRLLDMETATAIIGAYMRTFSNGLYRDLETFIITVLEIYKVDLESKSKHLSKLEGIINICSDRAMEEMKKVLESDELKVTKK